MTEDELFYIEKISNIFYVDDVKGCQVNKPEKMKRDRIWIGAPSWDQVVWKYIGGGWWAPRWDHEQNRPFVRYSNESWKGYKEGVDWIKAPWPKRAA